MKCPGSVRACASVPNLSSPYAEDGTEAHELLEYCLFHRYFDAAAGYESCLFTHWKFRADTLEDRLASVQTALDFVYTLLDAYVDAELVLEMGFEFPQNVVPGEAYGYADICIYVPSLRLLFVLDYKHGLRIVDAWNNPQLLFYATGAAHALASRGYVVEHVCMAIMQPRAPAASPIRIAPVAKANDLASFTETVCVAIAIAETPGASLVPAGPEDDYCDWCPARAHCPALERLTLQAAGAHFAHVKEVTSETLPAVATIPLDRLVFVLTATPAIEAWLAGCAEYARQLALGGVAVPEYKLVQAMARRRYDGDETTTANALLELFADETTLDDIMPRSLIGITEMEKRLKGAFKKRSGGNRADANKAAEAAKNAMAKHTLKDTSGKLVLVHVSDSRPAVERASQLFAGIQLPQITQDTQ